MFMENMFAYRHTGGLSTGHD